MTSTVEKARAAIARVDALGEARGRLFTDFDPERILADARRVDRLAAEAGPLPLRGMLIAIKDLFDEAGQRTTAGSLLLRDRAPAPRDAEVITRLKRAGAVPFGRTTMSEFAYSGVGLNPHYGTPGNALDDSRIPGGSTSGGAVVAALGLCDAALGTDTGGSVRIPAAANGLVGFKPSQSTVPLDGVHPLAPSYDSVGPLAPSLTDCAAIYGVISGADAGMRAPVDTPRLAVPRHAFSDGLDAAVRDGFERIVAGLRDRGAAIGDCDLGFLAEAAWVNRAIVSVEALAQYHPHLDSLEHIGDPRVLGRIRFATTLTAAERERAYATRRRVAAQFRVAMAGFDALLCPTLPIAPPTIAETERDFDRVNGAMLGHTSLINLADGCAITMPVAAGKGAPPHGLMLSAPHGRDWRLLSVAETVEMWLRRFNLP